MKSYGLGKGSSGEGIDTKGWRVKITVGSK